MHYTAPAHCTQPKKHSRVQKFRNPKCRIHRSFAPVNSLYQYELVASSLDWVILEKWHYFWAFSITPQVSLQPQQPIFSISHIVLLIKIILVYNNLAFLSVVIISINYDKNKAIAKFWEMMKFVSGNVMFPNVRNQLGLHGYCYW